MSDVTTLSFGQGKALSSDLRGTSPEQIAAITNRLEHIRNNSKDWVTPSGSLQAVATEGQIKVLMNHPSGDRALFDVSGLAHEQFAGKLNIPMTYYRRMMTDAPNLLVNNLNYWFVNDPQNVMLRTLDGRIRAALSQRYFILDSHDFMMHAFDEGKKAGAVAQRLDLSETRFYLRLLAPDFGAKITGRGADLKAKGGKSLNFAPGYKKDDGTWQVADDDDPNGDWVFPVVVASNSDVGKGKLNVEMGGLRATCDNLILVGATFHRVHLGAEIEEGLVRLSHETRKAKADAVWLEIRDVIRQAFNEEDFKRMLLEFNNARAQLLAEPVEAVDQVCKEYSFSDEAKAAILNELISPSFAAQPGATVWGLSQAVNVLQHNADIDSAYDLARIGGEIILKGKELVAVK